MSKHRPIHRGHSRSDCAAADALMSALVQPAPSEAQSESFRETTMAAALREFDRAAAPQREQAPVEPERKAGPHVVTVEGITLINLERIEDPAADAERVRAIIARHRATTR